MRTVLDGVVRTFRSFGQALHDDRERRHFQRLPDHFLRDAGISRSAISAPDGLRAGGDSGWWRSWG